MIRERQAEEFPNRSVQVRNFDLGLLCLSADLNMRTMSVTYDYESGASIDLLVRKEA